MGAATAVRPHLEPYTVDDLFELPPEWDDLRCEVIDGCLIVSPAASVPHQIAGDRLCRIFNDALPVDVEAVTASAVRIPGGNGPVPDVVVFGPVREIPVRGVPAEHVHTVVEVVSPTNAHYDRVRKRDLYSAAGIPCYWRVEMRAWGTYDGRLPVIVVRLRETGRWRTILAPAGQQHELPLAVGRDAEPVLLRLDPAVLIGPRSGQRQS